jgi:hypothetical protein
MDEAGGWLMARVDLPGITLTVVAATWSGQGAARGMEWKLGWFYEESERLRSGNNIFIADRSERVTNEALQYGETDETSEAFH